MRQAYLGNHNHKVDFYGNLDHEDDCNQYAHCDDYCEHGHSDERVKKVDKVCLFDKLEGSGPREIFPKDHLYQLILLNLFLS